MIADWTVPFSLTSALYSGTPLPINQLIPNVGYYFLRQDGCQLRNTVRAQKTDIPQADGAILHRRYVSGMEMDLAIQLWSTVNEIACDAVQQTMLDTLMGYLFNLINAGDNQGRISWLPHGAGDQRMLDDIRLFTYPTVTSVSTGKGGIEVAVGVDCALPYAESLTPTITTLSTSVNVTNLGNRSTYPVFRIYGPAWSLYNLTTGYRLEFDSSLPGCPPVVGYVEFDTLRNTAYLNGNDKNMKPGIDPTFSDFFMLAPGVNNLSLQGGTGEVEFNSAWA